MKGLLLAMAVGGLAGLAVGERDVAPPPDPWLAEALQGLKGGDLQRALLAVDGRLQLAPDEAAARVLQARLQTELDCERAMSAAEHALVNGDRAAATTAFQRVGSGCRQHPFAQTRLEQIGAP
jgi:hypothetical protein